HQCVKFGQHERWLVGEKGQTRHALQCTDPPPNGGDWHATYATLERLQSSPQFLPDIEFRQNCLASVANQSDESSCADQAQKGFTKTMTKAKAQTTETNASVGEQGAHVAPEKTPSKKVATPKA